MRLDPRPDVELIRSARRDNAPFGILFERHATSVYSLLRARIDSDDVCRDLTAETFAIAWEHRSKDRGSDVTIGPKPAGEALAFSTDFSHVGTKTVMSNCEYVALLPKVQYGTLDTFKGWLKARCPVVATWKSTTCTDLKIGGSWDPPCYYSGKVNNVPANQWFERFGPIYSCVSTYDYRTKAKPSRFANGAWAGPGWIYSGVRDGAHFCP